VNVFSALVTSASSGIRAAFAQEHKESDQLNVSFHLAESALLKRLQASLIFSILPGFTNP
jgi:hypothetical protein